MVTALDTKLKAKIPPIIAKFGVTITITEVQDNYVPATGANPQSSPDTWSIKGTPFENYNRGFTPGDTSGEATARTFIAGADAAAASPVLVPKKGWKVDLAGDVFRIVSVGIIPSGDLVAVYQLNLAQ